ncbi:MAG: hypothetical protein LKF75_01695 [Bacilli bacterium]|jgi:hypothetical protein|nr:hypothetical protein [Bacilli bacterium]MCH4210224.1 hypothetical protein [Bacilli bacterium]MCH4228406.1 hypothetical protein [Bacilli bacterium]MCH4277907.1 hypothetical protein [Bacilli bacterium]MCI2054905.1 hypothetical protein [Bacilli bacterium]
MRKKVLRYAALFVGLFGITATTAYFMTPGSSKGNADNNGTTSSGDNTSVDDGGNNGGVTMTPTEMLISKLAEGVNGIKANVDFSASLLKTDTDNSKYTTDSISITSSPLYFSMKSLDSISLDFHPTLVYKAVDDELVGGTTSQTVDITYLDSTLYLSALGACYKCSVSGFNGIIDRLAEDPFSIDFDSLISTVGSSLGSLDTSSFTDALSGMTYTQRQDGGYDYTLSVLGTNICMVSDSDYDLTRIYANNITLDNASISFDINIANQDNISTYIKEPSNISSYNELYSSLDLFGDIYSLVKTPRFGLDGSITLSEPVTEKNPSPANKDVTVSLDANADLSPAAKNDWLLGADIDVACGSTTQSISAKYLTKEKGAFLNYNDVMKASLSYTEMDSLIGKMKASLDGADTSKVTSLFDFITNSEVMEGISAGHYEKAINIITGIDTSAENKVVVDLDLSGLGLGTSSTLSVTLKDNVTLDENQAKTTSLVAGVSFSNIELSSFTLSGTFDLKSYVTPSVSDENTYDVLNMLPTVWDQGYSLFQTPQAYVSLSGSVMDQVSGSKSVDTGFTFTGDTEFDIKAKKGTGKITIDNQTAAFEHAHNVVIDVQGGEGENADGSASSMLFTYGSDASSNLLKGKLTIKALNDIIDLVKNLMNSTDERYTKFFDPLKEAAATTLIGKIMNGEYTSLIENKILLSSNLTANTKTGGQDVTMIISKDIMGLDEDFTVVIGFGSDEKISTLSVSNIKMSGKVVDINLTLGSYSVDKISQLDAKDSYMDFSDIAVLMQFGIDTSEANYWHLTATADCKIGSGKLLSFNMDVTLDFYIYVNGKTCQVIGYVNDIPTIFGINSLHSGTRKLTFVYDDSTIYLYGHNTWTSWGSTNSSDDYHYYTSSYFLSNILNCILGDGLGMYSTWTDLITNSSSSSDQPVAYENVLKNFDYSTDSTTLASYNNTVGDTATSLWNITLDLGALTNNSQLKDLTLAIGGHKVGTESILTSLSLSLSISAGISISISAQVHNVNIGEDYSSMFNATSDFTNVMANCKSHASLASLQS